jgi:hypothetical protein
MIYNNRAGDGVIITSPAFNVSKETMTMEVDIRIIQMARAVKALQALSVEDCVRVLARRIGEQTTSRAIEAQMKRT